MLTYAIVLLVVVAVLYGSFRVLGGGHEPVPAEDYRRLLRRLHGYTAERMAELDTDTVADEDADVELAHLPGGVRGHLLPGLQLHLEHGVGKRLDHGGVHLDRLFLDLGDDRVRGGIGVTATGGAAAGTAGTGWTTRQDRRLRTE